MFFGLLRKSKRGQPWIGTGVVGMASSRGVVPTAPDMMDRTGTLHSHRAWHGTRLAEPPPAVNRQDGCRSQTSLWFHPFPLSGRLSRTEERRGGKEGRSPWTP